MDEGGLAETAYDMEQPPPDNVQEVGSKVPPALLSLNNIVPVGVVGELELSAVDILNMTVVPEFIVLIFGEIVVIVVSSRFTVSGKVPELFA